MVISEQPVRVHICPFATTHGINGKYIHTFAVVLDTEWSNAWEPVELVDGESFSEAALTAYRWAKDHGYIVVSNTDGPEDEI